MIINQDETVWIMKNYLVRYNDDEYYFETFEEVSDFLKTNFIKHNCFSLKEYDEYYIDEDIVQVYELKEYELKELEVKVEIIPRKTILKANYKFDE